MKKVLLFCLIIFSCLLLIGCDKEEKENLFEEISYKIPDEFEKDESFIYTRNYHYYNDSIYCDVDVKAYEKRYYNEDRETWFKDSIRVNLSDEVSELKEIDISNNKAMNINVNKSETNETHYYYGFVSSNFYYLIDYNISNHNKDEDFDEKTSPCYKYIDEIIYSVKVK